MLTKYLTFKCDNPCWKSCFWASLPVVCWRYERELLLACLHSCAPLLNRNTAWCNGHVLTSCLGNILHFLHRITCKLIAFVDVTVLNTSVYTWSNILLYRFSEIEKFIVLEKIHLPAEFRAEFSAVRKYVYPFICSRNTLDYFFHYSTHHSTCKKQAKN